MAKKGPILLRRGTTAQWNTCNPKLLGGEVGLLYSDDGSRCIGIKFGNNMEPWVELPFFNPWAPSLVTNPSPLNNPQPLVLEVKEPCTLYCDSTYGPIHLKVKQQPGSFIEVHIIDIAGFAPTYPIVVMGQDGALVNKQSELFLRAPFFYSRMVTHPTTGNWSVSMVTLPTDMTIEWGNISNKPTQYPPMPHASSHGKNGDDPLSLASTDVVLAWEDISNKPTTFPSSWDHVSDKPSEFAPPAALLGRVQALEDEVTAIGTRVDNLVSFCLGVPDFDAIVNNITLPYRATTMGYISALLDKGSAVTIENVVVGATDSLSQYRVFLPIQKNQIIRVSEGNVLQAAFVPAKNQ